MRSEFELSIKSNQAAFGLDLADEQIERLACFYDLIQQHNEFLHLVGPMSAEEFAIHHILESLTLLEYLPKNTRFADVGAGGGLPAIPCLLTRSDLRAVLIESKEKKTKFLDIAVAALAIADRVTVVNKQFQEVDPGNCVAVTCRALDRFTEKLPRLIRFSKRRPMLLFGGENLRTALDDEKIRFIQKLTPLSDRRFLFITNS